MTAGVLVAGLWISAGMLYNASMVLNIMTDNLARERCYARMVRNANKT